MYKGYFLSQLRKYITTDELKYEDKAALQNILSIVGQKQWNVYVHTVRNYPSLLPEKELS